MERGSGSMSPFPYARVLYKMHISEPVSQHPYLRALCKIHASGYVTRSVAQCLRIHDSASAPQHPYLWIHDRMNQNRHGATARAIPQTGNRQRATTRRNKTEFQPDLDVSLPIRNRQKTEFQPHLNVSLPIRNRKNTEFHHT